MRFSWRYVVHSFLANYLTKRQAITADKEFFLISWWFCFVFELATLFFNVKGWDFKLSGDGRKKQPNKTITTFRFRMGRTQREFALLWRIESVWLDPNKWKLYSRFIYMPAYFGSLSFWGSDHYRETNANSYAQTLKSMQNFILGREYNNV